MKFAHLAAIVLVGVVGLASAQDSTQKDAPKAPAIRPILRPPGTRRNATRSNGNDESISAALKQMAELMAKGGQGLVPNQAEDVISDLLPLLSPVAEIAMSAMREAALMALQTGMSGGRDLLTDFLADRYQDLVPRIKSGAQRIGSGLQSASTNTMAALQQMMALNALTGGMGMGESLRSGLGAVGNGLNTVMSSVTPAMNPFMRGGYGETLAALIFSSINSALNSRTEIGSLQNMSQSLLGNFAYGTSLQYLGPPGAAILGPMGSVAGYALPAIFSQGAQYGMRAARGMADMGRAGLQMMPPYSGTFNLEIPRM